MVCLARSALALWCLGYPDRAAQRAREAIALAQALSHPFSQAFALCFNAILCECWRDMTAALGFSESAIELASREGFNMFVMMATLTHGAARADLGEGENAAEEIRGDMDAAAKVGARTLRPYSLGILARTYTSLGRTEEARALIAEALTTAAQTGRAFLRCRAAPAGRATARR